MEVDISQQENTQLEDFEARIARALKAWHQPGGSNDDLLTDLLIAQTEKPGETVQTSSMLRLATNQILMAAIDEMELQNPQAAQVLRLRYPDRQKLWSVANTMAVSEQTVSRLQRKGIEQLAKIISTHESAKRALKAQLLEASLPPPTYTRLFGVSERQQKLMSLLIAEDGPAVVALIGLGGLGKTALADMSVRQLIRQNHFYKVLWLRIEHQTLDGTSHNPELTFEGIVAGLSLQLWPQQANELTPQQTLFQLRQELSQHPYLIVIDNIESKGDTAYILDHLHDWTRPTKFLLTSRSRLSQQTAVYNFPLSELSHNDAAAFVRYHAQECGIHTVATASEAAIDSILEVTGGNPLALKLVVSLLDVLPISEILADLKNTQTDRVESMYHYIYWQSWNSLAANARTLLQAMPLVSESGGTPAYLASVTNLPKEKLWSALHELHSRSLIEVRGSIEEKRYGIHRLTNAFLCTEIISMPEWA